MHAYIPRWQLLLGSAFLYLLGVEFGHLYSMYTTKTVVINKELIVKTPHLTDRDCIVQMLYKNIYRLLHLIPIFLLILVLYILLCIL